MPRLWKMTNISDRLLAFQRRAPKEQKGKSWPELETQVIETKASTPELYKGNWTMAGQACHFKQLMELGNSIVPVMQKCFYENLEREPEPPEVRSWKRTEKGLLVPMLQSGIDNQALIFEYCLPPKPLQDPKYTNRIDVIVCGQDENGQDWIVMIEVKQWERYPINPSDDPAKIRFGSGDKMRDLLHPGLKQKHNGDYLHQIMRSRGAPDSSLQFDNICFFINKRGFSEKDAALFNETLIGSDEVTFFHGNNIDALIERIRLRTGYSKDGGKSSLLKLHCIRESVPGCI